MADNFTVAQANQTVYEESVVTETLRKLDSLAAARTVLNQQCEEVAALILPSNRGHFIYGSVPVPYDMNVTDQQVDATGMLALSRFMAICDSLITPRNMIWHQLAGGNDDLLKDRASRLWFYNMTRKLFRYRYDAVTNFTAMNQMVWQSLGAFGTGIIYVDHYFDILGKKKALRYRNIPLGKIYLTQNHQGLYDGFIRIMKFTALEALKIPEWREKLEKAPLLTTAAKQHSQYKYTFLQHVQPRDDWDPMRLDFKGKPYASYYVFREGHMFLGEGGYNTLPIIATRYQQAPDEQDGRSPAMDVLPSLKTLNTQKKVFLKQGHRAVDPVLLLMDDGLVSMNMKPGSQNKGGWSSEGKPLVGTLPIGDIKMGIEMMDKEVMIINDALLVALFSIMTEKNGMTATEVVERINEKGILIAPTLGRQEGEYLGPLIARELDCLRDMGEVDPMPPAMRVPGATYNVVFSSPLSRAMRAQEASGFMRTVESVKELVNVTGDVGLLDPFEFDTAIPAIAEIQGVPEPWMATPKKIMLKKQARAKQAQIEQQIKAAPAAAAMMKAQAVAGKAGQGQPQGQPGGGGMAPAARSLGPGPDGPSPGGLGQQ